ncbi:MAG TPA: hypothetical protein VJN88_00940 [Ktedonobacterales bacterium]|nr:hypothetical protein [Ktedonobacterales bacterium]
MRRIAGKRRVRIFAVIQHRGRRSGRLFTTPVAARKTTEGFVVPMTFGEGADWFRNVRAAGGCTITWNGDEYLLVDPEIVDWATAKLAFRRTERALMSAFGIRQFVRLRGATNQESSVLLSPRVERAM